MSSSRSGNEFRRSQAIALAVSETSQVGEARRAAAALVGKLGFDETAAGKLALVVTEAASNLVKHAGAGELVLNTLTADDKSVVQVLALDRGPGMVDLTRCLRDGYSEGGTPGTGLGAIHRNSSFFDIHTAPRVGTALVAELWSAPPESPMTGPEVGGVNVAHPGEQVSGDSWAMAQQDGRTLFLLADGLGHGPSAAQAARTAVRVFHENARLAPGAIIEAIHAALRSTRGAAVAAVEIKDEQLRFAGVGNISGTIFDGGSAHSLVSHNGTAGHALHRIQEFAYAFPARALLVLHSDGLATRWTLDQYPGLAARDPALIAGVLYRDFKRGRDDVTVVVVRAEDKARESSA